MNSKDRYYVYYGEGNLDETFSNQREAISYAKSQFSPSDNKEMFVIDNQVGAQLWSSKWYAKSTIDRKIKELL